MSQSTLATLPTKLVALKSLISRATTIFRISQIKEALNVVLSSWLSIDIIKASHSHPKQANIFVKSTYFFIHLPICYELHLERHTNVVPYVSCYKFSEIARVIIQSNTGENLQTNARTLHINQTHLISSSQLISL